MDAIYTVCLHALNPKASNNHSLNCHSCWACLVQLQALTAMQVRSRLAAVAGSTGFLVNSGGKRAPPVVLLCAQLGHRAATQREVHLQRRRSGTCCGSGILSDS